MQSVPHQPNCELGNSLMQAIARQEVSLHYQPIYSLGRDGLKLAGFEALSRWGDVSPTIFVKAAEQCGYLLPFCRWVFRSAMLQAKEWDLKSRNLWISVNLNPLHLLNENFLDEIEKTALAIDLDFETLHLELTENEALNAISIATLQAIGKKFQVGIDDFGAGYSNLSQIGSAKISFIKIDRSLLPVGSNDRKRLILLRAIATVAKQLRIETILEGIESEKHLLMASICGIGYGQGHLWSKALPAQEARLLLPLRIAPR